MILIIEPQENAHRKYLQKKIGDHVFVIISIIITIILFVLVLL